MSMHTVLPYIFVQEYLKEHCLLNNQQIVLTVKLQT